MGRRYEADKEIVPLEEAYQMVHGAIVEQIEKMQETMNRVSEAHSAIGIYFKS